MTPRLACPSRTSACAAALIAPRSFAMTRADARCSFFGSGWLGPSRRAYRLRAYARLRRRWRQARLLRRFQPDTSSSSFSAYRLRASSLHPTNSLHSASSVSAQLSCLPQESAHVFSPDLGPDFQSASCSVGFRPQCSPRERMHNKLPRPLNRVLGPKRGQRGQDVARPAWACRRNRGTAIELAGL